MITEAEAKDGVVKMMVKDDPDAAAQEVVVKIPVLGAYSETWPVNCPKSDKIVRNFADFLAANKDSTEIGLDGALLFLLSTGEEKDLEVVRGWMKKLVENYKDAGNDRDLSLVRRLHRPGLLRILPAHRRRIGAAGHQEDGRLPQADHLQRPLDRPRRRDLQLHGRRPPQRRRRALRDLPADGQGVRRRGGRAHAAKLAATTSTASPDTATWPTATTCPKAALSTTARPSGLAFTMAAAATLHPDGEKSVYAKARDISATKAFYSTSWLFHGHTGGGIGELWRGPAMGVVQDKRPAAVPLVHGRTPLDVRARPHPRGRLRLGQRLERQLRPTRAMEGRGWGNYIPLIYTLPRKTAAPVRGAADEILHSLQDPRAPVGQRGR